MFTIFELRLNKKIPIPLYYQLKQQILEKISINELKADDQIPNEMEFVDTLHISRSTVRQALNALVSEGYLYRIKAKGTFVSKPKVDEGFFLKLESFNDEMIQKGLMPSTKVLSLNIVPEIEEINNRLQISVCSRLIYLCRLRSANGEPVVYLETYLPYDRYSGLLFENFTTQSLYSVLEGKFNSRVEKAVREVEAVNANAQEARLLNIQKNTAICLVKTLAYLADGMPVEYSIARYRGDRNKFRVELKR